MSTQEERGRVYEFLGFTRQTIGSGSSILPPRSVIRRPDGKQVTAKPLDYVGEPLALWAPYRTDALLRWLAAKYPVVIAYMGHVQPAAWHCHLDTAEDTPSGDGDAATPAEALGAAILALAKEDRK